MAQRARIRKLITFLLALGFSIANVCYGTNEGPKAGDFKQKDGHCKTEIVTILQNKSEIMKTISCDKKDRGTERGINNE